MKNLILLTFLLFSLNAHSADLRQTAIGDFIIEEKLRVGSTVAPTVALDVTGDTLLSGTLTAGGLVVDTNTLYIDSGNNRVGIGKTNPATPLDVSGVITATGGISTEWNTAFTHSQNNSQEHTDYLLNNADDTTSGLLTATGGLAINADAVPLKFGVGGEYHIEYDTGNTLVFNEDGLDRDFRIESASNTHAFFIDASTGRIGIGEANPENVLHITGGAGSAIIFEDTGDVVKYSMGVTGGFFQLRDAVLGFSRLKFAPCEGAGVCDMVINADSRDLDFVIRDDTGNLARFNAGTEMQEFPDNKGTSYGTGEDSKIFYNNTDLIIDPKVVGTGIARFEGHIGIEDQQEMRFYEGANYVGFEAPALSANQIWVLPIVDGNTGDVLTTNGSGALSWLSGASEKSWAFRSRAGASGTTYAGGFYNFNSGNSNFTAQQTMGTANASYAAHLFVVLGESTADTITLTITGTSMAANDDGTRTASDTETITITHPASANAYFETTKKWIGQITIDHATGTAKNFNWGLTKYWDNNNTDFKVTGLEVTWLGGATDTSPNIKLRHHKSTGWTYNAGSTPTPPTEIAAMATDHSTEDNVIDGENGAWKRANLSTNVNGSGSEGTIIEIVTSANKTFELGTFLLRITPQ